MFGKRLATIAASLLLLSAAGCAGAGGTAESRAGMVRGSAGWQRVADDYAGQIAVAFADRPDMTFRVEAGGPGIFREYFAESLAESLADHGFLLSENGAEVVTDYETASYRQGTGRLQSEMTVSTHVFEGGDEIFSTGGTYRIDPADWRLYHSGNSVGGAVGGRSGGSNLKVVAE
jgi:hypothetical protein